MEKSWMQDAAAQLENDEILREQVPRGYPFVKWAGGKKQLLKELDLLIPNDFQRYFEPFVGGGAMFFHLVSKNRRFKAYITDKNRELITAYRVIKEDVNSLIAILKQNEIAYQADRHEYYYKLRKEAKGVTDIERAARFITLNKTCYNGLYRVNKNGEFNVPIGSYKNPLICDSKNLHNVSGSLRFTDAWLKTLDYKEALEMAHHGDFIYLDPPYDPTSPTSNFTGYTEYGFGDDDQKELCKIFGELDRKGCKIILSNSDTPLIRDLYKGYNKYLKKVDAVRIINCKASRRKGHKELVIRNFP
jgi:DNA adenine methylase